MNAIRYYTLLGSLYLMRFAIRRYGWRCDARPEGYPLPHDDRVYWRMKGKDSIETASFAEAVQFAIKEAKAEMP